MRRFYWKKPVFFRNDQGALKTLKQDQPVVFTEMLRKWAAKFNYHPNEVIALFTSLGYECFYASIDGTLLDFNEMTDETKETNFFFYIGLIIQL